MKLFKQVLCVIGVSLALVATAAFSMSSTAGTPSTDQIQAKQTEQLVRDAQQKTGAPNIVNFTERKLVKYLYELRDEPNYRTYSYIVTLNGDFIKVCDSVGYGINASIQYVNPERIVVNKTYSSSSLYGTLPQPEPNGLFMPEGLAATYVMCVVPNSDDVKAVYVESEVLVSPFPMTN